MRLNILILGILKSATEVYSYKVKCMVGTTLTECGKDMPCGYYSEGGAIKMKCGSAFPSLKKVECHTLPADDFATNWKCYCVTEGCNHKCEYKNKPEECVERDVDGEMHKVCNGTCMAKNTGTMTMKTMKTEKTMGSTKVTNIAPKQSGASTVETKVSGPNGMGTTSKSSNTNAAAFHVLVGMVILTTKQFL